MEEKNKQNFVVKKNIDLLKNFKLKGNFVQNLKNYFFLENKKYKDFNYRFVLKTNYLRSYWISENKKIRATIDTNIRLAPNDLKKN